MVELLSQCTEARGVVCIALAGLFVGKVLAVVVSVRTPFALRVVPIPSQCTDVWEVSAGVLDEVLGEVVLTSPFAEGLGVVVPPVGAFVLLVFGSNRVESAVAFILCVDRPGRKFGWKIINRGQRSANTHKMIYFINDNLISHILAKKMSFQCGKRCDKPTINRLQSSIVFLSDQQTRNLFLRCGQVFSLTFRRRLPR